MSSPAGEKSKVNILIVDDKPANICSVQAILSQGDYNLISATSGVEALKCILHHDFALILLDVMMPEMDGFEVARLVRQRGQKGVIPIIFLTAIATDFRYMQEGYAAGAVDYLQKPLDPDVVRAKVSVFVELYRMGQLVKEQELRLRELQQLEQQRRLEDMRQESERHFRKLADSLPQVVFTTDRFGQVDYTNLRWEQLTGGVSFETFHKESFLQVLHPEDQVPFLGLWRQALISSESLETELRLYDSSMRIYRWHLCHFQPERNLHSESIGWLATFTDIDHQKRREEAQTLLADASAILTASLDLEESLKLLSQRLVENFSDLCLVDLINRPGKPFQRMMATQGPVSSLDSILSRASRITEAQSLGATALLTGEAELLTPLGSHLNRFNPELAAHWALPSLANSSLLSSPIIVRGTLQGAVSLFKCVKNDAFTATELQVLNELCRHIALTMENLILYEEVRDNNRLKDEFLALLSHELRTPLNSILGWTELAKMEASEAGVLEGLAVVERSAHTLTQLVNDLLDVSRIISGKLEIEKQNVEINSFLTHVIEALQPLADSKGVEIQFEEAPHQPQLNADPSRLEQILWNLINNAIKFTPAQGVVRVAARVQQGQIEIEVSDTGIGIRAELLPYIFERFRQADSSSTRRHGGLGLGLAIVKHLAQLHEGSVRANSPGVGQGSTFVLSLPVANLKEIAVLPQEETRLESKTQKLQNMRILLVDDDPSTRLLTARQLTLNGARVDAAESVTEALELLHSCHPDIILTDIGMPGEDGFSLLKSLRSLEKTLQRPLRIAAFSAYAAQDDARRALAEGFDIYLTKPISSQNLIQAIVELQQKDNYPRTSSPPWDGSERAPLQ